MKHIPLTGRLVRWIREGLGLTQREFAIRIAFSQTTVCQVESGHRPMTDNFAAAVLWAFEEEVSA